ncbi:MAG: ATP synthase F1 subunit delta [Deltaproteobacteria bacterium]|nr:ATP synthase F1 subunit delta [Deltaproteobacteria bacterium]MBW1994139.1 ATP synthase F1 subunit delta [Deltaproteobacteria bacterium]MBW2153090.1 ATP synthase F1 subunit delta [Deltaproteobacteria bacterium]
MRNLAIARRYAKAMLLVGKEDGQAEAYREEMERICKLLESEKALEQAISNPLYTVSDRRKLLEIVIDRLDLSKAIRSFLLLLFDKGRIEFLRSINEYYQKFADELKGLVRAELVSATELSAETVEKIRKSLSDMIHKEVVLEIKQDPGLIGGVVTKIGDLVLDGSIKTQLLNMKESLKRDESI